MIPSCIYLTQPCIWTSDAIQIPKQKQNYQKFNQKTFKFSVGSETLVTTELQVGWV